MGLRGIWAVVYEAGDAWLDDRAPRIAAALRSSPPCPLLPSSSSRGDRRIGVRGQSGAGRGGREAHRPRRGNRPPQRSRRSS